MKAIQKLIEKLENPNNVLILGVDYFEGLRLKEIKYNSNEHVIEVVVDDFMIKVDTEQSWVIGTPNKEYNVFRDSYIEVNGKDRVALKDEFHKALLDYIQKLTPEIYFKLAPTKKLDHRAYYMKDNQVDNTWIVCHFININTNKREFTILIKDGHLNIDINQGVEPYYIYNYFGCAPKAKIDSKVLHSFLKLYKESLKNTHELEAEIFTKLLLQISK